MRLAGSCVLVVDDDPLVAASHADMIEDSGSQAVQAGGVASAWNLLRARSFDAIVLDHDLGDGKGFDLLKLMRGASIATPCIYLSAAGSSVLAEAAMLPELRCALAKPVSKEALQGALSKILGSKPQAQERYPHLVGDEEREMLLGSIEPSASGRKEGA